MSDNSIKYFEKWAARQREKQRQRALAKQKQESESLGAALKAAQKSLDDAKKMTYQQSVLAATEALYKQQQVSLKELYEALLAEDKNYMRKHQFPGVTFDE